MMKANSFTMWMNVCLAENSIRILSLNSLWAYFYSNNFQIWEKIAFALKQTLKQKKANFWKALSRPRGNHNRRFTKSHSEPSSLISKQDISVLKTLFVASNIGIFLSADSFTSMLQLHCCMEGGSIFVAFSFPPITAIIGLESKCGPWSKHLGPKLSSGMNKCWAIVWTSWPRFKVHL